MVGSNVRGAFLRDLLRNVRNVLFCTQWPDVCLAESINRRVRCGARGTYLRFLSRVARCNVCNVCNVLFLHTFGTHLAESISRRMLCQGHLPHVS